MADELDAKTLRREIDLALDQERAPDVSNLVDALWREHGGSSAASFLNARAARLHDKARVRQARLAILRSFTVEPVVSLLRAAGVVNRLNLLVDVGDFNTYAQEILSPTSALYTTWNPDVVILAVQTRDLAPELWEGEVTTDEGTTIVDRIANEFGGMIRTFRERSRATLVVHLLERPVWPVGGLLDRQRRLGQIGAIEAINERIVEIAAQHTSVYVLDYDALVARAGRSAWFDEAKWASVRLPIRSEHLLDLAEEWLRFVQAAIAHSAKAVVVDLDNTLWGGVIGEDGLHGIVLSTSGPGEGYHLLQGVLASLSRRGLMLGICSKNNEADARSVFDEHPSTVLRWSDFTAVRANWLPKSDNLRSIAEELNIGLDAMMFVDDNPAECDQVRRELPDVIVRELGASPAVAARGLARDPFLQRLTVTAEDEQRAQMYVQQHDRRVAEGASGSLDGFLHSLGLSVRFAVAGAAEMERVAQLTQKTNQFNVTTRRYSVAEIERMVGDAGWRVSATWARDRFGDHGLIGVLIIRILGDEWDIDSMLLSCRVIGRGVESAMLASVAREAKAAGAAALTGTFIPTAKNAPAADVFRKHGFALLDDGSTSRWTLDLRQRAVETPEWIKMLVPEEKESE